MLNWCCNHNFCFLPRSCGFMRDFCAECSYPVLGMIHHYPFSGCHRLCQEVRTHPDAATGDPAWWQLMPNWSSNNEAPLKAFSAGIREKASETKTSVILQVDLEKIRTSLCSHFSLFISIPTSGFWMLARPNVFMFPCALKVADLAEDLFGNWRKLMKATLFKSVLYRKNQTKAWRMRKLMESY